MKTIKILLAAVAITLTLSCTKTEFAKREVAMNTTKAHTATVSSLPEMDALEAY